MKKVKVKKIIKKNSHSQYLSSFPNKIKQKKVGVYYIVYKWELIQTENYLRYFLILQDVDTNPSINTFIYIYLIYPLLKIEIIYKKDVDFNFKGPRRRKNKLQS